MFSKTRWKTTSMGLSMISASLIGGYFALKSGNVTAVELTAITSGIIGGIGLVFAQDGIDTKPPAAPASL